jgi:hypothetical protein
MVVGDAFYQSDALEHFESLPHAERTQFFAEVHALAEHSPRRWPVDVGTLTRCTEPVY